VEKEFSQASGRQTKSGDARLAEVRRERALRRFLTGSCVTAGWMAVTRTPPILGQLIDDRVPEDAYVLYLALHDVAWLEAIGKRPFTGPGRDDVPLIEDEEV